MHCKGLVIAMDFFSNAAETATISHLRVNSLVDPLGIDTPPVFSWQVSCGRYGAAQSARRVIVSSSPQLAKAGTGDLWDSGKTEHPNHYDVVYAGAPLASKTTYYWRAQIWDEQGNASGWSETARFSTGILAPEEWQGGWIGTGQGVSDQNRAAVLLRKEFTLSRPVAQATAFVCGLGLCDLTVNGTFPDDSVLNPAQAQYDQTVFYRAYDVIPLLHNGRNALGVELGNGFYNENTGVWNWEKASWRDEPKLLLNLEILYQDGSRETIATDSSWKLTDQGPITANSIYCGETYDARKRMDGFDLPGFDDSRWSPAQPVSAPAGRLACQTIPPMRRMEAFAPKSIRKIGERSYLITSPEMVTGWIRLKTEAPAGQEITVIYGEQLTADGQVQKIGKNEGRDGNWWPDAYLQQDHYISDGTPRRFEPKFSYKGFQYVQVDNYPRELLPEDVTIYRVYNHLEPVSEFSCSNSQINSLHRLMRNTLVNNFQGKPTDTPVWEKNGWLGDANVALSTMMSQFDLSSFLPNFLRMMDDCFHTFGNVPTMVPNADWAVDNTPVWNTIFVFGAQELFDRYGQLETVRRYYPDLKRFALKDIAEIEGNGWVWRDHQLADWVAPVGGADPDAPFEPTPPEGAAICTTAFLYAMLGSMIRLAEAVGEIQDVERYRQAREKIFTAFHQKFYRPEQQIYDTGFWEELGGRTQYRQTSNLLPLAMGLTPPEQTASVVANLVQDILDKDCHLDTGCVGTKFLLPTLADLGYPQIAYRLLTQTTYPSWGYWLEQGATSAWELWERTTRSMDHYFLGTFDEFFYSHLAGIQEIRDGYRTFTLKPLILPELSFAEVSLQTVRGTLKSGWFREEDGTSRVEITVPFGAEAKIILPVPAPECVTVSPAEQGIQSILFQNGALALAAGSGRYTILISPCQEGN